jgi:hypothetical protein
VAQDIDILKWAEKGSQLGLSLSPADCPGAKVDYRSAKAESLHLKYRGFSRKLVVRIGYRRFWQHQPQAEIYSWLNQELQLDISERTVVNGMPSFGVAVPSSPPNIVIQLLKDLR